MGFYGNITNTSKTQFQFDHIYPNRRSMEQAMLSDGIYLGRHVLIEYDSEGLDGMKEVVLGANGFYYGDPDKRTLLTWANTYVDEVIYVKAEPAYIFYKRDSEPSGVDKTTSATFTQFTSGNEDTYGRNYAIDNEIYKSSRGYDSTVWQKVYTDNTERYVMIAELNTVIPKFAVATDAPTMTPVPPHFDTQSTDVYYKLHVQNPWIIRVAEAKSGQGSDAQVEWQEVVYDEKQSIGNQYSINTVTKNGAIYFNKAAFKDQVGKEGLIDKKVSGEDEIIVNLVSSGHKLYDDHDNTTSELKDALDIQELTINLPTIGNMMSDAWDIIHGPNRDNARTDTNSSLQGRLDSFDAFYENQIPIKRASDGTIVGSKINGANNYDAGIDLLTLPEGANGTITGFTGDDAWIETKINTTTLKAGDKDSADDQANNSGISIHHTFHATQNSTSTVDKNNGDNATGANYKQAHIRSTNSHHNNDDKIDLYVPYVDAKGHVVGHNIETVTLPYGFKTITTNGRSDEVSENATGTPVTADVVADTTQDILKINSGNKWIRIDTDATEDGLTIRHDVHTFNDDKTDSASLSNETSETVTFDTTTYDFDNAGHFTGKTIKTMTVPFGYGKVKGDSGETAATATYDELSIVTGDDWLTSTVSTDTVTITHDFTAQDDTETKANKNNDSVNDNDSNAINKGVNDTLKLYTPIVDATGHVVGKNTETVILPYGFKTITVGTESTETSNVSAAAGSVVADNTQDILTINPGNKWIHIGAGDTDNNDIITLSHEVNTINTDAAEDLDLNINNTDIILIPTWEYDAAGHITGKHSQEYTLPYGYKTFTGDSGTTSAKNTQDSMSVTGDSWVKTTVTNDNIAFAHVGPVSGTATEIANATPDFGTTFTISDHYFDEKGHKFESKSHTVKIPSLSLVEGTGNVVTRIALTDAAKGIFTETRANIGTLDITGYSKPTVLSNPALLPTESLNTALGKLEFRLAKEVSERELAISGLNYNDTAVANKYVSRISETNGIISVERADLPILQTGTVNGTIKLSNGDNVAVYGLQSAAYTQSSAYASAEQGIKADNALPATQTFTYGEEQKTIAELFVLVHTLSAEVNQLRTDLTTLQEKVNTEHPAAEPTE